ncbi:MAG TPA: carboxypeptidase-like regulatory domain-containing protein, partial [Gemmatimonadaceae bacterium]|nr:carboxypeptidase-like regulatory domain-containing protein [Gemmatimonadaceae bacterium]
IVSSGDGPVSGALIMTDETQEARSDENGRFWLRGLPSGTRQIEIGAIGAEPASRAVDIRPGDTAVVSVQLKKSATLPEVSNRPCDQVHVSP